MNLQEMANSAQVNIPRIRGKQSLLCQVKQVLSTNTFSGDRQYATISMRLLEFISPLVKFLCSFRSLEYFLSNTA